MIRSAMMVNRRTGGNQQNHAINSALRVLLIDVCELSRPTLPFRLTKENSCDAPQSFSRSTHGAVFGRCRFIFAQ